MVDLAKPNETNGHVTWTPEPIKVYKALAFRKIRRQLISEMFNSCELWCSVTAPILSGGNTVQASSCLGAIIKPVSRTLANDLHDPGSASPPLRSNI